MTREDIFGKIIKLSGRQTRTKQHKKEAMARMEMDRNDASKSWKKFLTNPMTRDIIKKLAKSGRTSKEVLNIENFIV